MAHRMPDPALNRRTLLTSLLGLLAALIPVLVSRTASQTAAEPVTPTQVPTTPESVSDSPPSSTTTPSTTTEIRPVQKYPDETFNGVRSRVAEIGNHVRNEFDVHTVYGKASRPNRSDHPLGLALDFMVPRPKGDLVAEHLLVNFTEYRVSYVIWRQRINLGRGWNRMEDRGSITANHYDHVHCSFLP